MKEKFVFCCFKKAIAFGAMAVWALLLFAGRPSLAETPALAPLDALFSQDSSDVDLVQAKFIIDRMIDPSIDVAAGVAWFERAIKAIEEMAGDGASDERKMAAVRTFIYKSGPWNDYRPFSYDHSDPLGTKISNKLMATYLETRRGNCVSMPFLVILLADRMGLEVSASTAPLHVFVKFTPAGGQTVNLEATSGALPARDVWYRENLPMSDAAIANGVYLKRLSREETLAVMASVLVEHWIAAGEYGRAAEAADVLIRHFPAYAYLHVMRGSALHSLIDEGFYRKYPGPADVPREERAYLEFLLRENEQAFAHAEQLGWRPEEGGLGSPAPPAGEK